MNTETIERFVYFNFSSEQQETIQLLQHYETFKADRPDTLVDDALYKKYAVCYYPLRKIQTICLIRQYEGYLAEKLVLSN